MKWCEAKRQVCVCGEDSTHKGNHICPCGSKWDAFEFIIEPVGVFTLVPHHPAEFSNNE